MASKLQVQHTTTAASITTTADSPSATPSAALQVVPAPGPARVTGKKAPSGSLATSQAAGSTTGAAKHQDLQPQEEALLVDFADVLNADGRLPPSTHGVEHHIVTSGPPITANFQRLDNAKLAVAKAEFQQLEKEGIVRPSSSDWASPLHMVQKSDGSWRPCGDFHHLNLISEADCYPLPNMAEQPVGGHGFQQSRPQEGLPPDPCPSLQHEEDSHHHPFWPL